MGESPPLDKSVSRRATGARQSQITIHNLLVVGSRRSALAGSRMTHCEAAGRVPARVLVQGPEASCGKEEPEQARGCTAAGLCRPPLRRSSRKAKPPSDGGANAHHRWLGIWRDLKAGPESGIREAQPGCAPCCGARGLPPRWPVPSYRVGPWEKWQVACVSPCW